MPSRRGILKSAGAMAAAGLIGYPGGASTLSATKTADACQPWEKEGIVIDSTEVIGDTPVEPYVLYEPHPKILNSGPVFKLWFSDTTWGTTRRISYAESHDGLSWTQYPDNPLVTGYRSVDVVRRRDTGRYWFFATNNWDTNEIDVFRSKTSTFSSDDLLASSVIPLSKNGWDSTLVVNSFTWYDGDLWNMLYEGAGDTPQDTWKIGLARSFDGVNWTKQQDNPVLTTNDGDGTAGGPHVVQYKGSWLCWHHRAANGKSPTNISVKLSPDLVHWIDNENRRPPTFPRTESWEGVNSYEGQVADPNLLTVGDTTYLYYAATAEQSPGSFSLARAKTTVNPIDIYAGDH